MVSGATIGDNATGKQWPRTPPPDLPRMQQRQQ